jgi:hypothetical protein
MKIKMMPIAGSLIRKRLKIFTQKKIDYVLILSTFCNPFFNRTRRKKMLPAKKHKFQNFKIAFFRQKIESRYVADNKN